MRKYLKIRGRGGLPTGIALQQMVGVLLLFFPKFISLFESSSSLIWMEEARSA
jgi:hypothetical protein